MSQWAGDAATIALVGLLIGVGMPAISEEDGLAIRGFGAMVLLGVTAGVALAIYRGKSRGVDSDSILTLGFWMFVLGIVSARLFYVTQYWHEFQQDSLAKTLPLLIDLTKGGVVVYGAFLGASLAIILFAKTRKVKILPLLDLVAPSMMIGLAFGRIGCLLNGCCYGGACDLPWGLHFPPGSPPHLHDVQSGAAYGFQFGLASHDGVEDSSAIVITSVEENSPAASAGINVGDQLALIDGEEVSGLQRAKELLFEAYTTNGPAAILTTDKGRHLVHPIEEFLSHSQPVHPTQIYSSLDALLLCLLLLAYSSHQRRDGEVFALMITCYAVSRFLIEIIRVDEGSFLGTGMSISQNGSVLLLAAALVLWFYILSRGKTLTTRMQVQAASGI